MGIKNTSREDNSSLVSLKNTHFSIEIPRKSKKKKKNYL